MLPLSGLIRRESGFSVFVVVAKSCDVCADVWHSMLARHVQLRVGKNVETSVEACEFREVCHGVCDVCDKHGGLVEHSDKLPPSLSPSSPPLPSPPLP